MCLRYSLKKLALAAFQDVRVEAAGEWSLGFNIALTRVMPVVTRRAKPIVEALRFGLSLPASSPAKKPLLLGNARAETLLAKPAFRDAAQHRRCLIPADGFYEWEKSGTARLPHYFTLKSGHPFFFAGVWEPETATTPAGFAIVTTTPNALLGAIHDRMPVILGPNSGPAWLGDEPMPPARLAQLCRPLAAGLLTGHRVDPRVNSVRYDAPDCINPV
jgi:putative SOS response-associated peptidase YedK